MRVHTLIHCATTLLLSLSLTEVARAQDPAPGDWLERCRRTERWVGWIDGKARVCEVREIRLPADGRPLTVDGRQNGGIVVEGWDRDEILVRARLDVHAETEARARADVETIRIRTDNHAIRAEGPDRNRDGGWSVGYQVFVPRRYALALLAQNGGIRVADVRGRIEMRTLNGGISTSGPGGNVRGRTTNGGLDVRLFGERWEGEGINLATTNGGVRVLVPRNYSARLKTRTVNGSVDVGFPVTVQGRVGRHLSTELGAGGAPVRMVTTNGSIRIRRPDAGAR
jgi:hypothetical protein